MIKLIKDKLAGLVLAGAIGLGVGVAGYNYLKDEELIPTPVIYSSVSENKQKSGVSNPPEYFLDEKFLSEENQKGLREDDEKEEKDDLEEKINVVGKNVGVRSGRKDEIEMPKYIQPYPLDILDKINASGRMPTEDYRDDKFSFIDDDDGNTSISYFQVLEDILGGSKILRRAEDNLKKGEVITDEKGRKFVALDKVLIESIVEPTTIITSSYEDTNKNGAVEVDEFVGKNDFSVKEDKKIVLGMYIPNAKKAKKGYIEVYNPKGERILESKFDINETIEKGEIELESLVKEHGIGVYTAAFYVNDKCWEVKQVNVGK